MTIKIEPGIFITSATLYKLGPIRYQLFRDAVRDQGYRVSDSFGEYGLIEGAETDECIRLDSDGDLFWSSITGDDYRRNELTLKQIELIIHTSYTMKYDPATSIKNLTQSNTTSGLSLTDINDLTIEQLAQCIQQLKDKQDQLSVEIDKYKRALIEKFKFVQ